MTQNKRRRLYNIYLYIYHIMIHLHTPVIKETIRPKKTKMALDKIYPEKKFHKVTKSALMNNVFNDLKSRQAILEILTLIEPWIYLHTNIKLVDHNHLPLIDEETINLISRGEYVVDYYFNVERSKYKEIENFNKLFSGTDISKDFFNKTNRYFQISNISFDLNIKTNNVNRFEILEKYAIESLTQILNIITDNFDALYNYSDQPEFLQNLFKNQQTNLVDNIDINYDSVGLQNIKTLMAHPNFDFTSKLMLKPTRDLVKHARQSNFQIISDIDKYLDELLTKYNDIMFFPYVYYFTKKANNSKYTSTINYKNFENTIINKINENFKFLVEQKLYNSSTKSNIFNDIIQGLNQMDNQNFYLKKSSIDILPIEETQNAFYDEIKLPSNYSVNNLEIIPRESVYIYNNNGKNIDVINSYSDKKHSLVINQSSGRATRSNTHIRDYDKVKIKINTIFKNLYYNNKQVIYPIDANIIVICINRITDTSYLDNMQDTYQYIDIIDNSENSKGATTTLKSYNRRTLIHKLTKKIFDGEHYLPWFINNYDKELIRLLFLLNLDQHEYIDYLKELLTTSNKKFLVNYSLFYCFNYESYSFYNLIWIDPSVNDKYYEISYIIKFIIIMDEITKLPDKNLIKIIKDYNTSYGWYDNVDTNNFRKSYLNFRTSLIKIIDTLDEMYHNNRKIN
ncbi:hypothetical protein QLL95_gp0807 [Cotonvirus japonicus]|uniref:Uncharacterized protein n=1 Tax=Cotonvirus japonicus TaxID=2811091 RepID=A0ABM7NT80_9VIRU|nr:hypothetical protein QLL95_gp0807 [Cotonvirus japonicus]BCS83316.1 hypothetical protein [Cotonvirus japonicus]